MRTKTTIFLAVLLAVVGALAYFLIPDKVPPATVNRILLPDEAALLDYLKLEFRDRPPAIVLEKNNNTWRITEPVLWPASPYAVDQLLKQLQFARPVSRFAADRLAEYKLDPPEGTVTYGFAASRRTLRLGGFTELGQNVYLLPDDGDEIIVVKRDLFDDLHRPLEELRSDAVFGVPLFEVRSWFVQIAATGNLRVHLVRAGEKWKLESPVNARADKATTDTLLKQILELKVASFWRDGRPDLNGLGLTSPALRLTIVGSGSRDALLLGAPVPDQPGVFYAKREDNDTVFTMRVDCMDELLNAQLGVRDRRVVDFEPERLQSLTLKPAGQAEITLQRLETGAWQVLSRPGGGGLVTMDGDPAVIGALVQEVAELRALRDGGFVSDAPSETDLDLEFQLKSPAWQVQIAERAPGTGEVRVQTLALGRRTDRGQYAMADERYVYLVDRGLADDLRTEPHRYRNRLLRQMAGGESITGLALKRLANDEAVFAVALPGADQTWDDALITQTPERRAAAQALLKELRSLRAEAIIAPEFPKSVPGASPERPWAWLLEATVALEGGETQQSTQLRLYLDAYQGGTEFLVGVPELNLVVSATPALIDALRPLIFERPVPAPETATPGPASAPAP